MIEQLQYGNTKSFFIANNSDGMLFDTDWAGTLPLFYREIKKHGIRLEQIRYLFISHYHPDHMGLAGELVELGIQLVILNVQQDHIHFSDYIFQRDRCTSFKAIDESKAIVISCAESRAFLAKLNIAGEILHTPGHSIDSISLLLDEGVILVGDLCSFTTAPAYNDATLDQTWDMLLSHHPHTIYYAHMPAEHPPA